MPAKHNIAYVILWAFSWHLTFRNTSLRRQINPSLPGTNSLMRPCVRSTTARPRFSLPSRIFVGIVARPCVLRVKRACCHPCGGGGREGDGAATTKCTRRGGNNISCMELIFCTCIRFSVHRGERTRDRLTLDAVSECTVE